MAEAVAEAIYTADRNDSPHFDDYDRLDPLALAWYQRMAAAALKVAAVDKARAVEEARRDALWEAAAWLSREELDWPDTATSGFLLACNELRRLAARSAGDRSGT
ncbi:hypothetical protein [Enterococcus hirae]|uniref:hypothetical protein n=1 Tax=Enterococcus hirae TaxID=1354 RepID=UPI00136ACCD3|nr:hypothetical protein [Enterococcus hirae]NAE18272.1 hypothetical protein [Enterococcus hirae]